jgi:hypothetical protein
MVELTLSFEELLAINVFFDVGAKHLDELLGALLSAVLL